MKSFDILPDVLGHDLRIVFCGTAAGNVSAARRAYYAHPQNRFWAALHAFGLTPRQVKPEDYAELSQWGLGLTDIAKHVSGVDRDLPPGVLGREACAALEAKIIATEPEWLAFTSLNAGRRYLGCAADFLPVIRNPSSTPVSPISRSGNLKSFPRISTAALAAPPI